MIYLKDGSNATSYDQQIKVDYTNPTDITCQAAGGNPPPKLKVYLGHTDITEWFIQRRMSVTYTGTAPWNQVSQLAAKIFFPSFFWSKSWGLG